MMFYFLDCIKRNWESKGSFFQAINRDIIENKLFPLPPLPEQERIVAKLDQLMKVCDEMEQSIRADQEQNEKLLQQLLRESLRG